MTTNPTMVSEENGDEAHLWKVRGINAVIPRGLKIEEEEQSNFEKGKSTIPILWREIGSYVS